VKPWLYITFGKCSAAFNMAMDEALLEAVQRLQKPVLRFYEWAEPAASFGYFQKYSEVENATLLRPLVRRPTAGGIVPHNADWTYSLAFPPMHEWYSLKAIESYRRVHEWVQAAFTKLNVATELAPTSRKAAPGQCFVGYEQSDVLWNGKKIAGAAQRRNKLGLLIQGSVQPPPIELTRTNWEQGMREHIAETGVVWSEFKADPSLLERTAALADEKYSRDSYNRRR
jgi:lipoate-protein ligase A